MKKSFKRFLSGFVFASTLISAFAQSTRKPWDQSPNPVIKSIEIDKEKPTFVIVNFDLETPRDNSGADKGEVVFTGPEKKSAIVGKTRNTAKKVILELETSGTYTVVAKGLRNGEKAEHLSEAKTFVFSLPLSKSAVSVLNTGNGNLDISWTPVREAEGYILSYTDATGKKIDLPKTKELKAKLSGLTPGKYSDITVTAVRGNDSSVSDNFHKLIKDEVDRIWKFTEFGTSTNPDRNRYELLDPNNLKVTVSSCTFDPKTGNIMDKGGKYESFFDGMSFYYTEIDPKKENFELTCTVTVDYHNPMPDGQEGFGVLALDQLGVDGEPMIIAYNNSAGIVSRKMTTHVNGVKKEIKDGIGARAVTGITPEIIAEGDAAISQKCSSLYQAFSYDQSDAVKTGDVYRVTLKKDNTGYHSIYKREIASEGTIEEYILYDNENEKLLQLDKKKIYVGFSVARGCNATFSDVEFKVTDPKKDPPAIPEPPTLVPLTTLIDCPTSWYDGNYPFVFTSNAKGTVTVTDTNGKVLLKDGKVEANKDFKAKLKINKNGINDLLVTFDPEDNWRPSKKEVIAQFNRELEIYEMNYKAVTYSHSVISKTFSGKNLYVSTEGTVYGKGTIDDPLDLLSATQYIKPGQTILLLPGNYYPDKSIMIERGNDGTAKARKVLKSADPKKRAVINFSSSKATVSAVNLYGSYWTIENIDITGTPDDCKALQVAGNYNQILMVDTYLNGDTGIQIAGRSSEPWEKWPHDNLIYGCESFGNADPAQNNADGFASKLTTGNGNVFRNCVSHHNVDDGWDLYAKIETGPIGAVLIDNCICYANGTKLDGSGKGDGNGFKMGGDGINVPHILRNSISWDNSVNGVTCNSNPGLILENVTVYGNGGYNIALYGKGDATKYPRTFKATGVLSLEGGQGDNIKEKPELAADNNFFFNGAKAQNKSGTILEKADTFVSVDTSKYSKGYLADGKTFNRIPRSADGVFDLGDLFKTTGKVPAGIGANYNKKK